MEWGEARFTTKKKQLNMEYWKMSEELFFWGSGFLDAMTFSRGQVLKKACCIFFLGAMTAVPELNTI